MSDDPRQANPSPTPYNGVGVRILEWYARVSLWAIVMCGVLLVLLAVFFTGRAVFD